MPQSRYVNSLQRALQNAMHIDPTLQEVVAAWDTLPGAFRDAIRVMLRAAKSQ